jgi:hypothetical protein
MSAPTHLAERFGLKAITTGMEHGLRGTGNICAGFLDIMTNMVNGFPGFAVDPA